MLHSLTPEQFSAARPLFGALVHHHLFCAGVLSGRYPGHILVDNPDRPATALLIKDGMWAYLGGNPRNAAFNQAIHDQFMAQQLPEVNGGLLISVASDGWRATLSHLFPERPPVAMARRHYVAQAGAFRGVSPLPAGFTLHFIDETLGARVGTKLPEDVSRVLELRAQASEPDQAAFGYVALQGDTYAAHAIIDCIVDTNGDIGLVTAEPFRRRGLAAATSAATIAYGLEHGLTSVFWDCMTYNRGSVRTAEKLGLRYTHDHTIYLVVLDEVGHLINLAWNHLDTGAFAESLAAGERLLALPTAPPVGHFLVGAAYAGLGDTQPALTHLNTAADQGWDGLHDLETCGALASLQGTPAWETLTARIRANAQSGKEQED